MTIKLLLPCLFVPVMLTAQQVTTLVSDPSTRFRDDLIFDQAGNLYCADYPGNSVYKRTPDGTVTTFATGFNTPNGLAFDSQDNLFVADNVGNRIYKINPSGQFIDTFTITGPSGLIKMPNSDTLLFTDYPGNSIKKLAPDGVIVPLYNGSPIDGAVGLAWSPDQRLYVANFSNSKVFEVVFGAVVTLDSVATLPAPAQGNSWLGFIEYANGFIWATAYSAHKIYKINPASGEVTLVAGTTLGSTDGDAGTAQFNRPNGIVASVTGDTLYVSDYGTGNLRMMTDIPLKLESPDAMALRVFPNPASGTFHISYNGVSPEWVELVDISGRSLKSWQKPEAGALFSAEGLVAGSYILRIVVENSLIEKIVVII